MTALELREHLNKTYGNTGLPFPAVMDVDAETYANICEFAFQEKTRFSAVPPAGVYSVVIHLGPEKGIMFKGVELVMRRNVINTENNTRRLRELLDAPVPPTIAMDDEFRDIYCQGYRHALKDALAAVLDTTEGDRPHMGCSKPMSRMCSMEEHSHCSGIFKTAGDDNLDVVHQCGCKCHLKSDTEGEMNINKDKKE